MRYIITRPCLQEGSLRLLKYLQAGFPHSGPAVFVDDKGEEHSVQVDTEQGRVWGLGTLYHGHHLNVNDVLMLTALAPARYQVEAIVKPHAAPAAPRRDQTPAPETRRVVVSSTPHVREVRIQEVRLTPVRPTDAPDAAPAPARPLPEEAPRSAPRAAPEPKAEKSSAEDRPGADRSRAAKASPERAQPERAPTRAVSAGRPVDVRFSEPPQPAPVPASAAPRPTRLAADPIPAEAEAQLAELGRLTGYRTEDLGGGVTRLSAELGTHGYAVLVATCEAGLTSPAWKQGADYRVQLTHEDHKPAHAHRLTREALHSLIEHARLSPLSPIDLRGYWKAGSVDLESAASVAELVGAQLAQRGAFSVVLLTLAQQPAHSVVSVQRLAERLGSGVSFAELGSILDTLTRPPFLALTPLPGGQYLLRMGMSELLTDLAEYADGVRRRVRVPAAREAVMV